MPARPQPATSHPRPVVGRVERFFASVALAAIAVAAAAVSVEIAARVYLVRFAPEWTFRKYASHAQMRERYGPNGSLYALHPYLGFVLASNYAQGSNRHNALGYRGEEIEQPKPAGVVRVVCIGGSTTYTTGVDDYEQSYPDQLERKLTALGYKVDVINAGVPGWSSWESLVNFQLRVLDLDPDLIVVYDALNDVGPRIVWPPTAYRGDNSGARKLDSVEPTLVRALSLSTAARFALVKFGYGPSQIGQESIAPTADTFLGDEFDVQSWTASYPAGIFDDHPVAEMIRANPPCTSSGTSRI